MATANAIAKIKADATKVLAKLAGPRVDIETCMQSDEFQKAPPLLQIKVENYMKEVTTMYDEAKGKYGDREPIPFSFNMSTLNKIVPDGKLIQKSVKELTRNITAEA